MLRRTASIDVPFDYDRDRRLQRRAMVSMWLAMPVMVLGLPAHLAALAGHAASAHTAGWTTLLGWLAWALTSATLWIAREQLATTWRALRQARPGPDALVTLGALGAYVGSLPALGAATHAAPIYFDVTAMALAWLLAGAAQRADLARRYAATLEQLALLSANSPASATAPSDQPVQPTRYLSSIVGGALIGLALLLIAWQLRTGHSLQQALSSGLALLAALCPCTLGIAWRSAAHAGAARAAAAGWIVTSAAAFWPDRAITTPSDAALRLGAASPAVFARIARAVRRAAWLNTCWAIGFNLLLLPLALRGPVDPLLPAAIMLLARLLIALTNRSVGGWSTAG